MQTTPQWRDTFPSPQKEPLCFPAGSPFPTGNHCSDFQHHSFPVLELHINGIILYALFYSWLIGPSNNVCEIHPSCEKAVHLLCTQLLSHVWLFVTPWTVAMGFLPVHGIFQTGVGCHFLLLGIFLTQGSNLWLASSALAGRFFTTIATWVFFYLFYCISTS